MIAQAKSKIREAIVSRLLSLVVDDGPSYTAEVEAIVSAKYRALEISFAEAAQAYELKESDPDQWKAKEAAAFDARAEFIDAAREYLLIDLTRSDALPIRPAHYQMIDVQVKDTSTLEAQSQNLMKTVQVLNKVSSDKIPELNYPTPYWRGAKLSAIRARLHSLSVVARKIHEAGIDPLTGEPL